MQEAIPYKSWLPQYTTNNNNKQPFLTNGELLPATAAPAEVVSENAIVVFAMKGCCMTHVVKRLLLSLGVNPPVFEVDEGDEGRVLKDLEAVVGGDAAVVELPAVFIGGELFGGLDKVMSSHIAGELVPVLKQAGALWL
ncbi:GRXC9 [Linum grandiflorum]